MDHIRIAIIGGGLGGACLANGLTSIPHLDVQVFEAKPEFSERGASVGLHRAATSALEHVVSSRSDLLQKAGAVAANGTLMKVASGPHAGETVFELEVQAGEDSSLSNVIVQRSSLLRELLAPLPKQILHAGKKASSVAQHGDQIRVTFDDGSSEAFDAVIGADGIFSKVRAHVHGEAAEEHAATPAGFWDSRNMVPFDKASKIIGEEYFKVDKQYGWAGQGGFIMHDVAENRTVVQCVMCMVEEETPEGRKRPLTREFLEEAFSAWLDGPIAKNMIDLTLDQPKANAYSQWEHKTTPTYAKGNVCLMGDAAHATTPFMGSGAAMAFEDAAMLSALLGATKSKDGLSRVFQVFDEIRRPRCQRIIDASKVSGLMMSGVSDAGLDPQKLAATLGPRWGFILTFRINESIDEALKMLEAN